MKHLVELVFDWNEVGNHWELDIYPMALLDIESLRNSLRALYVDLPSDSIP